MPMTSAPAFLRNGRAGTFNFVDLPLVDDYSIKICLLAGRIPYPVPSLPLPSQRRRFAILTPLEWNLEIHNSGNNVSKKYDTYVLATMPNGQIRDSMGMIKTHFDLISTYFLSATRSSEIVPSTGDHHVVNLKVWSVTNVVALTERPVRVN